MSNKKKIGGVISNQLANLKRSAKKMSIVMLASLMAATSSPSIANAQENYITTNTEKDFNDIDDIIEIPRYIDEEGKEQDLEGYIRYHINRSRQERGEKKIDDTDPIYKSYLESSSFTSMKLFEDYIELGIYKIPYNSKQYDFVYNIGSIEFLNIENTEALKRLSDFSNIQIGTLEFDVSSNNDFRIFSDFLTKNPINVFKLNVNANQESILNGENIVSLSNMPGLAELNLNGISPMPIDWKKVGTKNDNLKNISFHFPKEYNPLDIAAMYFHPDDINKMKERGINVEHLGLDSAILEDLNNRLDEMVSYLYSTDDFVNMSEEEKMEEIIQYIGSIYKYNIEVSGEHVWEEIESDDPNKTTLEWVDKPPENKDEYTHKQYENGLFTPLIDPVEIKDDKNPEELNAICGNYAALFVALWERIGGKAYYVSDDQAVHGYCIVSMDGAYCIVNPTDESFTFEDAIKVPGYDGSDNLYTKELVDKYTQAIEQDYEKVEKNKRLDERRETIKQELARKREERIRKAAEEIINILKNECEITYDENGNVIGINFDGKNKKNGITDFFDKIFDKIHNVLTININGANFKIKTEQFKNMIGNLGKSLYQINERRSSRTQNIVKECLEDPTVTDTFDLTKSQSQYSREKFIGDITVQKDNEKNGYAAGPVGPKGDPLIQSKEER